MTQQLGKFVYLGLWERLGNWNLINKAKNHWILITYSSSDAYDMIDMHYYIADSYFPELFHVSSHLSVGYKEKREHTSHRIILLGHKFLINPCLTDFYFPRFILLLSRFAPCLKFVYSSDREKREETRQRSMLHKILMSPCIVDFLFSRFAPGLKLFVCVRDKEKREQTV